MLRLGILLLLLKLALTVKAQRDSILLKPVSVYGIAEEKYLAGSVIQNLDSSIQSIYRGNHLGEILSFQFPIYFRNYGNGMASGISMRGTAPHHTAVLWNGININSFSLGQADFSLLPATAFKEIKVHTGGGSARFGSGAFGGAILLNTGSDDQPLVYLRQEAGSFGRYFTSAQVSAYKGGLSFSSSVYHLQSDNDFPIGNNERQQHAAFMQQGFVQHLQYQLSTSSKIQLNYWFHNADRDIQPTIGSLNNTDEQQDRNHRLVVSYEQNNNYGLLKAGGGMISDKIIFNQNPTHILRWVAFSNHQYSLGNRWNLQSSVDWNHIIGKIEAYGDEPDEDRVDIAAAVQKEFERINLSFNLRQPFVTGMTAPLLPYVGADVSLLQTQIHQLRFSVNASKNFRVPTFNDRYWQNAGNLELLPETSYATEASLTWKAKKIETGARAFYQLIDEWIQWIPGSDGVFRPRNVKQVSVKGLEAHIESTIKSGSFSQRFRINYQLTRSITEKAVAAEASSIGKQLIFTPIHTASAYTSTQFKKWTAGVFAQYNGKRFTEASNSPIYSMRSFVLMDLSLGKSFGKTKHRFNLSLTIKNIIDTKYELYSGRAMPGRHFNAQITYQLNKPKNYE